MTTHEYMAALKAAFGITSDYALAKKMGVTQPVTSKWRQGKNGIDDSFAPLIAETLNRPVQQVLADLHAEREKSPELRKVWQSISLNYAVRACIICVLASFNITLAPRTYAHALHDFSRLEHQANINSRSIFWHAVCRAIAQWLGFRSPQRA